MYGGHVCVSVCVCVCVSQEGEDQPHYHLDKDGLVESDTEDEESDEEVCVCECVCVCVCDPCTEAERSCRFCEHRPEEHAALVLALEAYQLRSTTLCHALMRCSSVRFHTCAYVLYTCRAPSISTRKYTQHSIRVLYV